MTSICLCVDLIEIGWTNVYFIFIEIIQNTKGSHPLFASLNPNSYCVSVIQEFATVIGVTLDGTLLSYFFIFYKKKLLLYHISYICKMGFKLYQNIHSIKQIAFLGLSRFILYLIDINRQEFLHDF